MSDLRCPYCGGFISITMETVGPAYLSYERPEVIECESIACGAEWEPNGDLRTPGRAKP